MRFLNAYEDSALGIITLAKQGFLQKKSDIHPATTQLFSTLGYEIQLLAYYKERLSLNVSIETAQQDILEHTVDLQQFFMDCLNERTDISAIVLKHYFYMAFLKKTKDISLIDRCEKDLMAYCDTQYTPLPNQIACESHLLLPQHQITIEYSTLTADQIAMSCGAMVCTDQRHRQWLAEIDVSYQHFSQTVTGSDYRFRLFPDETSYKRGVLAFGHTTYSSGFYISQPLNGSRVPGDGYGMLRSDNHSLISLELNYVAFRSLPRSFNEGIAYVVIHGICGDSSYLKSLKTDIHNLTSLDPLLDQNFIGYNPSVALMSYLVDTHPPLFSEVLRLHQEGRNEAFTDKLSELVRGDTGLHSWLQSQLEICSAYPLKDLQAGDCPSIHLKDYAPISSNSVSSTIASSVRINLPTDIPKPIFYQDYFRLIRAIEEESLTNINTLLHTTHYLESIINYRDPERNFQMPLMFALSNSKGDCSAQLIEILLRYGANQAIGDKFGVTPVQLGPEICKNWSDIKLIFNQFSKANRLPSTPPVIITNTTSSTPSSTPLINATSLTPYKPKLPYEFHIEINVTIAILKGTFLAFSRIGFDKLQQRCLLVRRNPTLFLVAQSMLQSMAMSTMNLFYFPSTKGSIGDLNEYLSGGLYFTMDLGLMFGLSFVNAKLQPLLDSSSEKESWASYFFKKTSEFGLMALYFFIGNLSFILGEKFQDHELEASLNLLSNTIVSSLIYKAIYSVINMASNCLTGKSEYVAAEPMHDFCFDSANATDCVGSITTRLSESYSFSPDPDTLGIENLIELLDKRLNFFNGLPAYWRLNDALEDLKMWAKKNYGQHSLFKDAIENRARIKFDVPSTIVDCMLKLEKIETNVNFIAATLKHSENKDLRIKNSKDLMESLLQRFRLLALLSTVEANQGVDYLSNNLKSNLNEQIEITKKNVECLREAFENKKELFKEKDASKRALFFKYFNNLENTLYDATLIAHINGCYERYPLTVIRKTLQQRSDNDPSSENNPNSRENVYADFLACLRYILTPMNILRKHCFALKDDKIRASTLTTLDILSESLQKLIATTEKDQALYLMSRNQINKQSEIIVVPALRNNRHALFTIKPPVNQQSERVEKVYAKQPYAIT